MAALWKGAIGNGACTAEVRLARADLGQVTALRLTLRTAHTLGTTGGIPE
jgi:hypothetical protein